MVKRNVWPACEKNLKRNEILLIIGARQVGKTTLLFQIRDFLQKQGKQVQFFSLENPSLLQALDSDPENLFAYIPKDREERFLLLDEVQYLASPSRFLKYHYDNYGEHLKLIVSGSSAFYIDRTFTDSLAGRKRIIELFPFSFSEYLRAKGSFDLAGTVYDQTWCRNGKKRKLLIPQKQELMHHLLEFVSYGGYPKVVTESDPEEKELILKDLHESFLKKDILESGVSQEYKFYQLVKILASDSGSLMNASELGNTVGLSPDTVREYLHILRKSYIVDIISPFHANVRKELTKMPKVYFLDSGFRNTVLGDYRYPQQRLDKGNLLENLVFITLRTFGFDPIHFWRTQDKHEVDFVLPKEPAALEVKWQSSAFDPKKYRRFTEAYPRIPLLPVFYESEDPSRSAGAGSTPGSGSLELIDLLH